MAKSGQHRFNLGKIGLSLLFRNCRRSLADHPRFIHRWPVELAQSLKCSLARWMRGFLGLPYGVVNRTYGAILQGFCPILVNRLHS